MTPVQITERELVGFYKHSARLGLGPLSDVEVKCCEAVVTGCDTRPQ